MWGQGQGQRGQEGGKNLHSHRVNSLSPLRYCLPFNAAFE